MKRIIRVFPRRTAYTPNDEYAFVGMPPGLFIPEHDEVHISVTFTWDMDYAEELAYQWEGVTNKKVKIGGGGVSLASDRFYTGPLRSQGNSIY